MTYENFHELKAAFPVRNNTGKPVGRFAPSPTGYIHLGNVWAALIAWLAVRKEKGTMIMRIEDLDPDRSKTIYIQKMLQDFNWLGLNWDEGPMPEGTSGNTFNSNGKYGPYEQDRRRAFYSLALDYLKEGGHVYPCFCTRKDLREASAPHAEDGIYIYSGACRDLAMAARAENLENGIRHAWRMQVPDRIIEFQDMNYGAMSQNLYRECGDFVLQRTDGVHAYQLAVTLDDGLMGVNHVVRGADLLDSVPRQVYLLESMGFEKPAYGHVPLLKGEDAKRLSKRHKSLDLQHLRDMGWKSEALIGLLGFKAGLIDKFEPLKADELIAEFDWAKIPTRDIILMDSELVK